MITINWLNLVYFVPQYVVATLVSIYVFILLRRRRPWGKLEFILSRDPIKKNACSNEYVTSVDAHGPLAFYLYNAALASSGMIFPLSGFSTFQDFRYLRIVAEKFMLTFSALRRPRAKEKKLQSTKLLKPAVYEKTSYYDVFSGVYPISLWAGILLLLTPYQRLSFFIPHFSTTANLIIAIILGIAIFEATIALIVFHTGKVNSWILIVEGVVFMVATFSFFTPSMSWFTAFSLMVKIEVYSVLMFMILTITFLIFQLNSKRSTFLLALYSSGIAYAFFISITMYNIISIAL